MLIPCKCFDPSRLGAKCKYGWVDQCNTKLYVHYSGWVNCELNQNKNLRFQLFKFKQSLVIGTHHSSSTLLVANIQVV